MPETEDKPEPDLDALLELFREPDDAPPRKRLPGSVWLMGALVLSMAGIWQAAKVATGHVSAKAAVLPMKPTKASDRTPLGEMAETVGVVEDYLARCRKGMTAREVRWIVEDFQKAGLDRGVRGATAEEFIGQRKAQHTWYLDLLADGLRLDPEQRRAAEGKLVELSEEAVAEFREKLDQQAGEPFEHDGRRFQVVDGSVVRKLIDAKQWLIDERYAPWELCELSDEQKRATWFGWLQNRLDAGPGNPAYESYPHWINPESASITDPLNDDPGYVADFPTGDAPGEVYGAGTVFPFVDDQTFADAGKDGAGDLVVQAMGCHPAQLKTSLLLDPAVAGRLLEMLDPVEE